MSTANANGLGGTGSSTGGGGGSTNIITALGQVFKMQTGDTMSGEKIAQMLIANMGQLGELAKQGKLTHQQITQLKEFAEKHKTGAANGSTATIAPPANGKVQTTQPSAPPPAAPSAPPQTPTQTTQQQQQQPGTPQIVSNAGGGGTGVSPRAGIKGGSPTPVLSSAPTLGSYPISQTLETNNPGPVAWGSAQQGRPTLTGGVAAGRMSGTPAQVMRGAEDVAMLNLDESRARRKNTPGDQSMRRSIQDLVSSVDPNVKVEPEVEDLLLSIADEFIDSVANFACRLAKHRGGDTLEVRDLQLHLERNHNIRIPGFSSDETRMSLSQPTIAPVAAPAAAKKTQQVSHMTLRSHRLAQVQQAKREAKLV